jgi:hypothetical protein
VILIACLFCLQLNKLFGDGTLSHTVWEEEIVPRMAEQFDVEPSMWGATNGCAAAMQETPYCLTSPLPTLGSFDSLMCVILRVLLPVWEAMTRSLRGFTYPRPQPRWCLILPQWALQLCLRLLELPRRRSWK